jgi:hypothetical protein
VFTARYAVSPCIEHAGFARKGLKCSASSYKEEARR